MGDQGNGSGFSLAFTNTSKRKISLHDDEEETKKEIITAVGHGEIHTLESHQRQQSSAPKIISKQENTYRAGANKFKPSSIPHHIVKDEINADGMANFETVEHDATAEVHITYGLNKREANKNERASNSSRKLNKQEQYTIDKDKEAQVLKQDLEVLPPQASLEAYEAMPIESFGEALLRGMGWSEGKSIGRNTKEEVVAKELVRRPQRLGLGAEPAPPTTHENNKNSKKILRPGESRHNPDLVYIDGSGTVKSSKPVDAVLVERKRKGVHPGKIMHLVEGKHSGLRCEIISVDSEEKKEEEGDKRSSKKGSEKATVRLLPSYETVVVRCFELDDEERKSDEKHRPPVKKVKQGEERAKESGRKEEKPWLTTNIRVKIIDKKIDQGKLYLKKGTVVDVKTPTVCDIYIDDMQKSVLDVHQSQVETVIPNIQGTPLIVVSGRYSTQRGRLLHRNSQTGMAAVQLTGDPHVYKLSLDDIAQYCGPTDDWE